MIRILTIAIILFALLAVWFGIVTHGALQSRADSLNSIEHSVTLAMRRVPQARDFFERNRQHLELLAASQELQAREVSMLPGILVSVADDMLWSANEWHEIPWLTQEETEAALILLRTEEPGANDVSIFFGDGSMNFTLFGTPLHAVLHGLRSHAWVIIQYGDYIVREDLRLVHTETIDENWNLIVTSVLVEDGFRTYLFITILFAVLSLASLIILIWGIRTFKFIPEPDNTFRTIVFIFAAIVLLVLLVPLFFARLG